MKTTNYIAELPERYTDYTIEPCQRFPMEGCPGQFTFKECEPEEANTWTLYGQIPEIGVQMIGNFDTLPEAEEIFARITGLFYTATSGSDARPGLEVIALEFLTRRQAADV